MFSYTNIKQVPHFVSVEGYGTSLSDFKYDISYRFET